MAQDRMESKVRVRPRLTKKHRLIINQWSKPEEDKLGRGEEAPEDYEDEANNNRHHHTAIRHNFQLEKLNMLKRYVDAIEESNKIQGELLFVTIQNYKLKKKMFDLKRMKYDDVEDDSSDEGDDFIGCNVVFLF